MQAFDATVRAKNSIALSPVAIATDTTTVGATIDSLGFEGLEFSLLTGVVTDGTYTLQLFAGDAANMSDEVQVVASSGELVQLGVVLTSDPAALTATDDDTVLTLGYIGKKRYTRLKVVSASTTTGALVAGVATLVEPRRVPFA